MDDKYQDKGPPLDRASTAEDIDDLAAYLYGERWVWNTGVIHPTSVWRGPRGDAEQPLTLRIGQQTPKSAWDLFALGLARARADAILTSGRILRLESELRHDLPGPAGLRQAFESWRHRTGKTKPPISLVMTRSGEIDFDHPLFTGSGRVVIYTSAQGAWRLDSRAADAGAEVEAVPEPTARGAIEFVRGAFGCATISIEAGPSLSRGLYEEPVSIDEVLLSTYIGENLPTAARGGRQIPRKNLERLFRPTAAPRRIDAAEGSQTGGGGEGAWRFERFLRA